MPRPIISYPRRSAYEKADLFLYLLSVCLKRHGINRYGPRFMMLRLALSSLLMLEPERHRYSYTYTTFYTLQIQSKQIVIAGRSTMRQIAAAADRITRDDEKMNFKLIN
ncbi:unnamed protein product [Amoebophrya sp. A120]|nr:unnamed protein product [Amoebophrya sp. A120]|eukprot:GSA120T00025570001.1